MNFVKNAKNRAALNGDFQKSAKNAKIAFLGSDPHFFRAGPGPDPSFDPLGTVFRGQIGPLCWPKFGPFWPLILPVFLKN